MKEKLCRRPTCRKPFKPKTLWQKYCSAKCRYFMINQQHAKRVRKWRKIAEQQERSRSAV